jgi:hypothetical protein
MATDRTSGYVLDEPGWYAPLLEPDWLLPPPRSGAVRVLFVTEPRVGKEAPGDAMDLRLGLPMYLAEAIRMSTDAATAAPTFAWDRGQGGPQYPCDVIAVVDSSPAGDGYAVSVTMHAAEGGEPLAEVDRSGSQAEIGALLSELPRAVAASLRGEGVNGVWAPVYAPPSATTASRYVMAHRLLSRLRDPAFHPVPDAPWAEQEEKLARVKASLGALSNLASGASTLFPSLLFIAAIAATRACRDESYQELRRVAAAIAMKGTAPQDPLFRLSVLIFRLYEEHGSADQRTRALMPAAEESLKKWLTRVQALRWER